MGRGVILDKYSLPVRTPRLSMMTVPSKQTPYAVSLLGQARYSNLNPPRDVLGYTNLNPSDIFGDFQAHDVSSITCSQPLTGRYVTLQVETIINIKPNGMFNLKQTKKHSMKIGFKTKINI